MLWIHRYIGFVLSLFFLLWFLSGFVMMYKDFPYLSRKEALERMEGIPKEQARVSPYALSLKQNLSPYSWASIKMVALRGRPVYKFQDNTGEFHCFFADNGEKVPPVNRNEAKRIARRFMRNGAAIAKVEVTNELDQWTPRTRFLPYLPAYRVYSDDGNGTVCYVSSVTGEVFQKLDRADKIWAWLGAIPHWIYFKDLRIRTQLWRDVLVAISILGSIMCLAGLYCSGKVEKTKEMGIQPLQKGLVQVAPLYRFYIWPVHFHLDFEWLVFHESLEMEPFQQFG